MAPGTSYQGKGLFVLMLLCTPPAAAGVLVLAATAQRRIDGARTAVDILRSVTARLVIACVVLCALLLATAAIWAGVEGIHELAREPQIHTIGADEASAFDRDNPRRAGIFWLVIAALLTAMTITAALALWAAWQKRRAG